MNEKGDIWLIGDKERGEERGGRWEHIYSNLAGMIAQRIDLL